jgi:leader peptidase (prepilin peptidase) / N-methyltransferase
MDILFTLPVAIVVFLLGASIGSFLNVVIYRLPAGLSLIHPPSRCPHCLTRLKKTENIPVFGWIRLKGKCGHCKAPISIRYPIVEAVTGLLFLLVFFVFGISLQAVGYWAFLSWLLALALIDLDTMTLPNSLTQSGLVLGLVFHTVIATSPPDAVQAFVSSAIAAVLGIWLLDIISLVGSFVFGKEAMGAGDAKLMAMMGAWLGWKFLLLAGFLACVVGALVGVGGMMLGAISRQQQIPFGPFLALGAAIAVFSGELILNSYLQLFPTF